MDHDLGKAELKFLSLAGSVVSYILHISDLFGYLLQVDYCFFDVDARNNLIASAYCVYWCYLGNWVQRNAIIRGFQSKLHRKLAVKVGRVMTV